MLSWKSPSNVRIVGAAGLPPATIRDEVSRGARFVIYHYCVSILVLTFKRPSSIRFIKPGQSRLLPGIPFSLISFVFGWWGFPWGPIYTMQALVNNILGGRDVTGEILASIAPQPADAPAAAAPAAVSEEPGAMKKFAVGALIVAATAAVVVCAICAVRAGNLKVVLVAGTPQPYSVTVDGVVHKISRGHPVILAASEGRFTVTGSPAGASAGPQTFEFSLPFFSHLTESRVAVVNADRTAIIFKDTTTYYERGAKPDPNAQDGAFEIHANEDSYFLAEPDFVFTEFPKQIQLPSGATRTSRTRIAELVEGTVDQRISVLLSQRGREAALRHLELLADLQPGSEELLRTAVALLKPEEGQRFFDRHLGDRPILVEWHRYYQQFAEIALPGVALAERYRALLDSDRNDGALFYLLARITPGLEERRALNRQALAAPKPCYYAHNSLGFDALSRADFHRAAEHFTAAAQHGLKSESLTHNLREARLGLGEAAGLLAEAEARLKAAPADVDAAGDVIALALLTGRGRPAAEKIKMDFLARAAHDSRLSAKTREGLDALLSAAIEYGCGNEEGFARQIGKLDVPAFAFQAALSRGDAAAAAAVVKRAPGQESSAYFLCYIISKLKGDEVAAQSFFEKAREALDKEGSKARAMAARLRDPAPLGISEILSFDMSLEQRRILIAALAVRNPTERSFAEWAGKLNTEPGFPHLIIARATAGPAS